jgi:hypothetical protein
MMTEYDPTIIHKFADEMYRRADGIVITYTLIGAAIGLIGIAIPLGVLGALLGAVVGGAIGYGIGNQKAFSLKLEAQVALCQVKIEENTRL